MVGADYLPNLYYFFVELFIAQSGLDVYSHTCISSLCEIRAIYIVIQFHSFFFTYGGNMIPYSNHPLHIFHLLVLISKM